MQTSAKDNSSTDNSTDQNASNSPTHKYNLRPRKNTPRVHRICTFQSYVSVVHSLNISASLQSMNLEQISRDLGVQCPEEVAVSILRRMVEIHGECSFSAMIMDVKRQYRTGAAFPALVNRHLELFRANRAHGLLPLPIPMLKRSHGLLPSPNPPVADETDVSHDETENLEVQVKTDREPDSEEAPTPLGLETAGVATPDPTSPKFSSAEEEFQYVCDMAELLEEQYGFIE